MAEALGYLIAGALVALFATVVLGDPWGSAKFWWGWERTERPPLRPAPVPIGPERPRAEAPGTR